MPAPTPSPYDWASNTNHAAGSEPWSGQPTKVEPSAGQIAAGFVPDVALPVEWLNKVLNNFGEWIRWLRDETVKGPASSANSAIAAFDGTTGKLLKDSVPYVAGNNLYAEDFGFRTIKTRIVRYSGVLGARGRWVESAVDTAASAQNTAIAEIPLDVPHGCTVQSVIARVQPGQARAGGSRVQLTAAVVTSDSTATTLGTAQEDDGTTTAQPLTVSGLTHTVNRETGRLVARVRSGSTGAANPDTLYYIQVTYTQAVAQ